MPNMGFSAETVRGSRLAGRDAKRRLSMADALFSSTQQRVLALLFGNPDRSFYANEVIGLVDAGSGAVQRELKKLEQAALVNVTWHGNQKHYRANSDSPIFDELRLLMRKTVGLAEPLKQALAKRQDSIDLALIFGSVAKGTDTARSDIDLLIVSDELTLEELYALLSCPEAQLARTIQPQIYRKDEFRKRLESGSVFLKRELADDTIVLFGELPRVE
jgi:predicted nucleotidyltransferase